MRPRLPLLLCIALSACGDGSSARNDAAIGADDDAGLADLEASSDSSAGVPCSVDYPAFVPGMSVSVGALVVKVLKAIPAPPRQKVANRWVVEVSDANGPVSGATLVKGDTYMPVHRHHGNTPPTISPGPATGTSTLDGVDFIMRGPWQVLFDVFVDGRSAGTATIQVCVE